MPLIAFIMMAQSSRLLVNRADLVPEGGKATSPYRDTLP